MIVSIITWLIAGLAAGFLVNLFFPYNAAHRIGGLFMGICGAFFAGIFYSAISVGKNLTGIGSGALLFATVFSVIASFIVYYAEARGR